MERRIESFSYFSIAPKAWLKLIRLGQYSFSFEGKYFQAFIAKSHQEETLMKAHLVKINT